MSGNHDVTVIMAVKNGEPFLATALASVRGQMGVAIELIVVDGASIDCSRAVALEFGARVIDEGSLGLARAWNAGIHASSAQYVAFLDSDDIWQTDSLAARLRHLQNNPEADFSVGRVKHFVDGDIPYAATSKLAQLLREQPAPIPGTMLFRRRAFDRVGLFDPEYAIAADADWLARSIGKKIQSCQFDGLVLMKRLHASNLTGRITDNQRDLLTLLRKKVDRDRS